MRGGYAATVAVPAWTEFMKAATRGDTADWYKTPATLVKATVCQASGLRATEGCRAAAEYGETVVYDDYFVRGHAPADTCTLHDDERMWTFPMEGDAPVSSSLGAAATLQHGQENHH